MRSNTLRLYKHLFLSFAVTCAVSASAQTIPLNTLTLNGNATLIDNAYLLLTSTTSQAGSAFIPTPYKLGPNSSFAVIFVYNAYSAGIPADGLAFIAQNTAAGPNFLGMGGSGLGFLTLMQDPAIAVTFDYYSNEITGSPLGAASIALPIGTDLVSVVPAIPVYGGGGTAGRRYVWVDYNNPSKSLSVFYSNTSTKPTAPTLTSTLTQDLSSLFNGQVYFGFSGGTGSYSSEQAILYMHVAVLNR